MSNQYLRGFKKRPPDEEIIELYKVHRNSIDVGAICGCSGTTVLHILHRTGNGHLIAKQGGSKATRKPLNRLRLTDAQIVERYKAGISISALMEQTGGTHSRVKDILEANRVRIRTGHEQLRIQRDERRRR